MKGNLKKAKLRMVGFILPGKPPIPSEAAAEEGGNGKTEFFPHSAWTQNPGRRITGFGAARRSGRMELVNVLLFKTNYPHRNAGVKENGKCEVTEPASARKVKHAESVDHRRG